MLRKLTAEFIGTAWLVLGGCGSAVLAAAFPQLGIGFVGVSLAFGLTVLTMAYAIGHVSGCHLNPAVSVGLWAGGRFQARELAPYIVAQVLAPSPAQLVSTSSRAAKRASMSAPASRATDMASTHRAATASRPPCRARSS
jgi:glycerol uptake facilitator-like aquaporin